LLIKLEVRKRLTGITIIESRIEVFPIKAEKKVGNSP